MEFESIIGYIAASLTTISFLPQMIRVVMTKKTEDISRNMYILLNIGVSFWLFYGFLKTDYPIIIANTITLVFSLTILIYKIIHK
ncbi:MAG TPA: SemiSWEET transporter [Leptospiraceae bacterium]|nr:SemiSWEET transporter [Leptospiraceae bacterium]HMW07162.1 SemiSWEET transporter [Leptospiraceae bacterium]HMX34581.1 SemiSWEET transporter [Leptospiraceae bacterium]HMY32778.1 SemiSWEET transporter [Leptospiraceae bacterium]HMZ65023.1 SemiSWEET transporter [Leptospiraceae bacterium]